mgnify:CR=1 FL=1|tara:strand:+ start:27084 stop:27998 length:915 start_codon:yes stop_codon:yes gene_type:complete
MAFKNSMSTTSPFGKLVLLGVLMLLGMAFSVALLFALNMALWDLPIGQISVSDMQSNPDSLLAAKLLQMASQIGLFILPAFGFAYFISPNIQAELSFKPGLNIKNAVIVVAITLLAIPFINLLAQWNSEWHLPEFLGNVEVWMREKQATNDRLMEVILVMDTVPDIVINIVMMAFLPAIGEELIFRGIIQKQLVKWLNSPHWAIFLTSVFFSAFHMQFLGFFSRLILGMIFGYLFHYSKNIRVPILAHFTNNFLALLLAFYFGVETAEPAFENPYSLVIVAPTLMAFAAAVYLLMRNKEKFSLT